MSVMSKTAEAQVTFSRIGGHVALDLLNTVEWRLDPEQSFEDLTTYGRVLQWARQAELIDQRELTALRRLATDRAQQADAELVAFRHLREAAYAALVEHDEGAVDEVVSQHRSALARAVLRPVGDRWAWAEPDLALTTPRDRAVRAVVDLLTSPELATAAPVRGRAPAAGSTWTPHRGTIGAGASPPTAATGTGPAASTRGSRRRPQTPVSCPDTGSRTAAEHASPRTVVRFREGGAIRCAESAESPEESDVAAGPGRDRPEQGCPGRAGRRQRAGPRSGRGGGQDRGLRGLPHRPALPPGRDRRRLPVPARPRGGRHRGGGGRRAWPTWLPATT